MNHGKIPWFPVDFPLVVNPLEPLELLGLRWCVEAEAAPSLGATCGASQASWAQFAAQLLGPKYSHVVILGVCVCVFCSLSFPYFRRL